MNQQLERQIIMLQDKVEEAKRNLKDGKWIRLNTKINSNDKPSFIGRSFYSCAMIICILYI